MFLHPYLRIALATLFGLPGAICIFGFIAGNGDVSEALRIVGGIMLVPALLAAQKGGRPVSWALALAPLCLLLLRLTVFVAEGQALLFGVATLVLLLPIMGALIFCRGAGVYRPYT